MNPFIPSPLPPSAPRNLSAAEGYYQITLTWEPPLFEGGFPVSNYRIHRRTLGNETVIAVGNVLTYTDAGLMPGQWYDYSVTAVNAVGEGPKSNDAGTMPLGPPTEPAGEKAALDEDYLGNIAVEWYHSTPGGGIGVSDDPTGPQARDSLP